MNNRQLTFNEQQQLNPQVFFKQPATWSRAIIWALISLTTCGIAWASVAKIEKVISATGKLEPQGAVQEIQASVNGVVADVYVEDSDRIEKGDVLLELDRTALNAQIKSSQQIKQSLVAENNYYRQQMNDSVNLAANNLELSPEIALLLKNKQTILAENNLYSALLIDTLSSNLTPEQQTRWQILTSDRNSRILAAEQEIQQLQWQLQQTISQQNNARKLLTTAQNQFIYRTGDRFGSRPVSGRGRNL